MHHQAEHSNGIGGIGHDRFQHKPELERSQSSERMQYQLFDHGRAFDTHHQLNLRYRGWTDAFNQLHLLADGHRFCRFIVSNDGDCVDIRTQHSLYGWMV